MDCASRVVHSPMAETEVAFAHSDGLCHLAA